jgi:hypothetical protein
MGDTNMKKILLACVMIAGMAEALQAQQFTQPALPPGVTGKGEAAQAEILKVYSMEDQGATFRAYVVKYKGNEVTVSDDLAATTKKVGDKITMMATRVEVPFGDRKIHILSFRMMPSLPGKK